MPCYDPRDSPSYGDDQAHRANTLASHLELSQKNLRERTDMLCELCTRLERVGKDSFIHANIKLSVWWQIHKELDAERTGQEKND